MVWQRDKCNEQEEGSLQGRGAWLGCSVGVGSHTEGAM